MPDDSSKRNGTQTRGNQGDRGPGVHEPDGDDHGARDGAALLGRLRGTARVGLVAPVGIVLERHGHLEGRLNPLAMLNATASPEVTKRH